MQALRWCLGLLGTLALTSLPAPAGAQPVGSEFQINTYTTGIQATWGLPGRHVVAADANGNFIVVWQSFGQDGDRHGIFGQRYDSNGGAQGGEFQVNTFTTSDQQFASVASDASGNFVAVWQSNAQDGSGYGILGQRYDSAGGALGNEFRVNSYTTAHQTVPSMASDANGNFVVVWQSSGQDGNGDGIFGQRYDSNGGAQGGEFRVNSYTTQNQSTPSVACDADGDFVVVWDSIQGPSKDIFGQRYDSAGQTLGTEFRVNSYRTSSQGQPSITSDANGNFVVAWYSYQQDGDYEGIFAQRYDNMGVTQGNEFQVNSVSVGEQVLSSLASDESGNFMVVWQDEQNGNIYTIKGRHYDSTGAAQGPEFHINSLSDSYSPFVGATGTNQFVVAWTFWDAGNREVFGQRFDFSEAPAITVASPNTNVKWQIGSHQRIKWTHNLGLGATFRIELDRDDDGDYEELIASDTPAESTKGSFVWTVTGPPSGTARVRVAWTDDLSVSDASDVTFQIRPVGLD